MSDTPRTDESLFNIHNQVHNKWHEYAVSVAFARQLEREISTVAKERDALKAEVERLKRIVWGSVHNAKARCGCRSERWVCVRDSIGVGSTTATNLCREHGLDPHEILNPICGHIEEVDNELESLKSEVGRMSRLNRIAFNALKCAKNAIHDPQSEKTVDEALRAMKGEGQ